MIASTIDELEEVYIEDIQPPFTVMARSFCDMGPYKSINLILSTKNGEPTYIVVGEKQKDFNIIISRTDKIKEAERKYYHATSKYLFP